MKQLKIIYDLVNQGIIKWQKKHKWTMYILGLLLVCGGILGTFVLAVSLITWGVHFVVMALVVGLCGELALLGGWEVLSVLFWESSSTSA